MTKYSYTILMSSYPSILREEVQKHMSQGWRPQGGITCYTNPEKGLLIVNLLQAMVLEHDD